MQWDLIKHKYSIFVFDCDGVILDSNKLKSGAFAETVAEFGRERSEAFVSYHQENGGISRQEKFKFFCQEILQLKEFEDLYQALLIKYADIVTRKLASCAFVPGVVDFMSDLHHLQKTMYVVTGGSQSETKELFKNREIYNLFTKILGNPISKDENMQSLKDAKAFDKKACYFGDSLLDYQLAVKYGLDFIFIYGHSEWSNPPEGLYKTRNFL